MIGAIAGDIIGSVYEHQPTKATDFPTNVLKLARAVSPCSKDVKQHVFYDWGFGSYHSSISAGATGVGIHKNILDGYRYIVQNDKSHLYTKVKVRYERDDSYRPLYLKALVEERGWEGLAVGE